MLPHSEQALSDALHSVRWNVWFMLAIAVPFLLLFPTAFFRRWIGGWIGGPIIPVAVLGSWICFWLGVRTVFDALQNYEQMTGYYPYGDTGLAMAPITWGIPVAVGTSALAASIAYVAHVFLSFSREHFAELDLKK